MGANEVRNDVWITITVTMYQLPYIEIIVLFGTV